MCVCACPAQWEEQVFGEAREKEKRLASGQWQSRCQLTTRRASCTTCLGAAGWPGVATGVGGAHKLAEITLQKAPSSSRVKDASWARDLGPASDGISAN
jgi:hypothetical protein